MADQERKSPQKGSGKSTTSASKRGRASGSGRGRASGSGRGRASGRGRGSKTLSKKSTEVTSKKSGSKEETFKIGNVFWTFSGWSDYVKKTVSKVLTLSMTKEQVEKFTREEYMPVWVKAFTHSTVDIENNFELLEFQGDAVLYCYFSLYLQKRFPNRTEDFYTELRKNYQGDKMQGDLAYKFGFHKLIRSKEQALANFKLTKDSFESFFGALFEIANQMKPGLGGAVCYNLIVDVYDKEDISEDAQEKDPKTQVKQIFRRFTPPGSTPWVFDESYKDEKTRKIVTEVVITSDAVQWLKNTTWPGKKRIDINQEDEEIMIGEGEDFGPRTSSELAYQDALEYLNSKGLTSNIASEIKHEKDRASIDPKIRKKVETKLKKEDMISFHFKIPKKMENVIQMIGKHKSGKEVIVSTLEGIQRYENSREQVAIEYLSQE
jgi:dsRNA-specific ribonuclease